MKNINKEQTEEKKTISLGETINILENKMTDNLIETYERGTKNYKMFALLSGVTGATSAMIIAGNILLGNNFEALSCTGTTIAMASYAVGNALLAKHTAKKAKRVKESLNEDLSLISALKSKLTILKEKLEYNRITGVMYGVSGAGFTATFISQLFRPESTIAFGEGFVIFSSVLAGLVGVGTAVVSKRAISEIKNTKLDIAATEEALKYEEDKNPEEAAKLKEFMNETMINEQSKGRTFK